MKIPLSRPFLIWLCLAAPLTCRADYGWIPKYKSLFLRLGIDYFRTSENFDSGGLRDDIRFQGTTPATLTDYRFWIEPEYGVAQDISVGLKTSLVVSSVDPQVVTSTVSSFLGATGLGDVRLFMKWNVKRDLPLLTVETFFKMPTYSSSPLQADDLVFGDGSYDFGALLHIGYRIKKFFFTVAPGGVYRFGDYAPAAILQGALGGKYGPAHAVIFGDAFISFGDNLLYDSSPAVHNAFGTGGSYARLSGSPSLFTLGLKVGFNFSRNYFFEAALTQAVSGRRAPSFTQVGLNFLAVMNFFEVDRRIRIKEVPFDAKPEDSESSGAKDSRSSEPSEEAVP